MDSDIFINNGKSFIQKTQFYRPTENQVFKDYLILREKKDIKL